jgi:type IX secretion system PorP/SprF family membrane protein
MKHFVRTVGVAGLLAAALCLLPAAARAQQDPIWTMYMFNRVVANPAFAGHHGASNFTFAGRSQWVGIEGNPNTAALTFSKPWYRAHGAIGGYLTADRIGPFSSTNLKLAYAYNLQLNPITQTALQFGIGVGLLFNSLDGTNWRPPQTLASGDNTLVNAVASSVAPSIDFGVTLLAPDDRYYLGLGITHINQPALTGFTGNNPGAAANQTVMPRTISLTGGYRFPLDQSGKATLMPSVFVRTTALNVAQTQVDLNMNLNINPMVFGITYRFQDAVAAIIGFKANKFLFVGYSYDYTLSRLGASVSGSHEIVISYTLDRVIRFSPIDLSPRDKKDFR